MALKTEKSQEWSFLGHVLVETRKNIFMRSGEFSITNMYEECPQRQYAGFRSKKRSLIVHDHKNLKVSSQGLLT